MAHSTALKKRIYPNEDTRPIPTRRPHPGLCREELSEAVEARGGYFNNTLSGLKTAGFVEYPRNGQVRLQPWTVME